MTKNEIFIYTDYLRSQDLHNEAQAIDSLLANPDFAWMETGVKTIPHYGGSRSPIYNAYGYFIKKSLVTRASWLNYDVWADKNLKDYSYFFGSQKYFSSSKIKNFLDFHVKRKELRLPRNWIVALPKVHQWQYAYDELDKEAAVCEWCGDRMGDGSYPLRSVMNVGHEVYSDQVSRTKGLAFRFVIVPHGLEK